MDNLSWRRNRTQIWFPSTHISMLCATFLFLSRINIRFSQVKVFIQLVCVPIVLSVFVYAENQFECANKLKYRDSVDETTKMMFMHKFNAIAYSLSGLNTWAFLREKHRRSWVVYMEKLSTTFFTDQLPNIFHVTFLLHTYVAKRKKLFTGQKN